MREQYTSKYCPEVKGPSDPRPVAPERLKTILREPVTKN
jgi:hypothetical protein